MEWKIYGQEDSDPRLKEAVEAFALSRGATSITLVCHQRIPLGARICRWPGSLRYEFILNNSNRAFAARQLTDGSVVCPFKA